MDQRTGLRETGCHGALPEELRTRTGRAAMGRPGASSRRREQQRPWGGTELKKRKRLSRGRETGGYHMTLQTPGRRWGPPAAQPRSSASPGAALGQVDPGPRRASPAPSACGAQALEVGGPPGATDYGGVGSWGMGKLSVGASAPPAGPARHTLQLPEGGLRTGGSRALREASGARGQWRGAVLSPCRFGRTVVVHLARGQGPSGESGSLRDS